MWLLGDERAHTHIYTALPVPGTSPAGHHQSANCFTLQLAEFEDWITIQLENRAVLYCPPSLKPPTHTERHEYTLSSVCPSPYLVAMVMLKWMSAWWGVWSMRLHSPLWDEEVQEEESFPLISFQSFGSRGVCLWNVSGNKFYILKTAPEFDPLSTHADLKRTHLDFFEHFYRSVNCFHLLQFKWHLSCNN